MTDIGAVKKKHVEHISDNDVVILNFEILYASEMVGLNQKVFLSGKSTITRYNAF